MSLFFDFKMSGNIVAYFLFKAAKERMEIESVSELRNWLKHDPNVSTWIVGMVIGLTMGFALHKVFSPFSDSIEHGALLIKVMVIPTIVFFSLVSYSETFTKSDIPARFFIAVAGGYEVGLLLLAWRILLHWYRNPDNGHMEPLFVAVCVAIAVLDWSRSRLVNLK